MPQDWCDENKKITGTKILAAVSLDGLPVLFTHCNQFSISQNLQKLDSISDFMTRNSVKQFKHCFVDKAYGAIQLNSVIFDTHCIFSMIAQKHDKNSVVTENI